MTTETETETTAETEAETNKRDLTFDLTIPVGQSGTLRITSKGSKSNEYINFEANLKVNAKTSDMNECVELVNTLAKQISK